MIIQEKITYFNQKKNANYRRYIVTIYIVSTTVLNNFKSIL